MFSGRNLDWAPSTGLTKYKTITVFHVADEVAHAAVAFAGLTGAITGMSAAGITVHEAGDDNKVVTLDGWCHAGSVCLSACQYFGLKITPSETVAAAARALLRSCAFTRVRVRRRAVVVWLCSVLRRLRFLACRHMRRRPAIDRSVWYGS